MGRKYRVISGDGHVETPPDGYVQYVPEEYRNRAPRLIGNALIPTNCIDAALTELKRAKELGFKSIQLRQFPNGSGAPKPEDDQFWALSLELGLALSPHFSFGGSVWRGDPRADTSPRSVEAAMSQHAPVAPAATLAQLIAHGVFDRFPEIQFYFAELDRKSTRLNSSHVSISY